MLAQANVNIADLVKAIEEQAIEPMLECIYSLDRQFLTREQVVMVTGKKGLAYPVEIRPWELRDDVEFMATGSTNIKNNAVIAQQIIALLNLRPEVLPILKIENLLKALLESWEMYDVDQYINPMAKEDLARPSDENLLLNQLERVDGNPQDDDVAHLAVHIAGRGVAPREAITGFDTHIRWHMEQLQLERQMAQTGGLPTGGMPTGRQPLQHAPQTMQGIQRSVVEKGTPR
jgi:hypothetical protein